MCTFKLQDVCHALLKAVAWRLWYRAPQYSYDLPIDIILSNLIKMDRHTMGLSFDLEGKKIFKL